MQHVQHCDPGEGMTPICGFHNPEDLAAAPDSPWLLVSQFPENPREQEDSGDLIAFHTEDGRRVPLFPAEKAVGAARFGEPGCSAAPEARSFSPHGIDLDGDRLYVVNHGGREAIEIFEFSPGDPPALRWGGCVPLPDGVMANDVVGLGDGSFLATHFMPKAATPVTMLRVMMGWSTGEVLAWSPEQGWQAVPHTEDSAPNGIEVSPDGRQVYYASWGRGALVRVDRNGGMRREVELGFHVDNLTWTPDGRLLAAGQSGPTSAIASCPEKPGGTCGMPFVVVAVDPDRLEVTPVLEHDPPIIGGAASVALQHRGVLWVGTFSGDRLLRMEVQP